MRTSLMDFTRGSQIAETVAMMFGTALRPMLLTALAIMAGIIGWLIWTESQPRDGYYWLMHIYASSWLWMEFNPQKLLGLKTLTEGTIMVRIADVTSYPPLQAAWLRLWSAVSGGVLYGSLIGVPLAMVSTVVLRKFGHGLTERKHKRGAQLASAEQLRADVIAFNLETGADDRAADKRRILGRGAWHKAPLWTKRELIDAGMYEPFTLAGIPYPWRAEQSHTMLVGTTGTGKSTVMKDLLKQIRARRGRAVVFDLTGTFIETFYNPHTDIILNPFDARCPKWSPFSDAHTREHFKEASLALVPMSDGGGEQFWPESARMIFVETCVRLVEQGRGNAQALSDVLMTSKLKDLHAHVLRTVAAPLTDPEAKRMAESIRATFNTYAQALLTLPTEGRDFSVRDWVLASETQADDPNRHSSVLFVAAQHVNLRSVRVLLTMWLSTAINTLMSMPGDQRDIRLWLLLDEIGALHNIPAIVSGMQTARNYGGAFVLGVHTIAQLKETYGDNYAETIASLAKTKLLMNTRDRASQEWESGQVGDGEWSEMEENWSYGANNVRDAATLQRKVKLEPLVIPSEFAELPDLTGYLKYPQGLPAALVRLKYVKFAKPNQGFIERKIKPLAPPTQILALPHYVARDGTKITADGEIIDPSGEGFQVAQSTTEAPERTPDDLVKLAQEATRQWVEQQTERERVDLTLDPRMVPPLKPVDGGGNTAAASAEQRERRENDIDRNVGDRTRETTPDGLAVQEQRIYLGEAEQRRRDYAKGNNLPAREAQANIEIALDDEQEWGRD